MYDHIGLKVKSLDASVRFYTAALGPLGYVLCSHDESGAGFGPKGEPALWLYPHKGPAGAGAHIAFRAPDHAAIRNFHSAGLFCSSLDEYCFFFGGLRACFLYGKTNWRIGRS